MELLEETDELMLRIKFFAEKEDAEKRYRLLVGIARECGVSPSKSNKSTFAKNGGPTDSAVLVEWDFYGSPTALGLFLGDSIL